MNLEKLGLLILFNYFSQLGEVKQHLAGALREVLLAVRTSVAIFSRSTEKTLFYDKAKSIGYLFDGIDRMLELIIQRVEPVSGQSLKQHQKTVHVKGHILNSIVGVIDEEIDRQVRLGGDQSLLKVEALTTVKKVLQNQMGEDPAVADAEEFSAPLEQAAG